MLVPYIYGERTAVVLYGHSKCPQLRKVRQCCTKHKPLLETFQWRHNERHASQVTIISIVCSAVCSGADQRKRQSTASLAFVRGIHRWPVNSPHKGPVTRKLFTFDDVILTMTKCSGAYRPESLTSIFHISFSCIASITGFQSRWCFVRRKQDCRALCKFQNSLDN